MKFNLIALSAAFVCSLMVSAASVQPCEAQFLKKLEQQLMQGNQGQAGLLGGQGQAAGNTSLPAGQYMMTNMQTGQGFYVTVNPQGQMFVTSPANGQQQQQMMPGANGQGLPPQGVAPGVMQQQQSSGFSGLMKNSVGNFLKNELNPGAQQMPQQVPQQY